MRKSLSLLCILIPIIFYGQTDIIGSWEGKLKVADKELKIIFNIKDIVDSTYIVTMDSPDQGVKGIPASLKRNNIDITIDVISAGIKYQGMHMDTTIVGTFIQNGYVSALNLTKKELKELSRPQEPIKPYPYISENIIFDNTKDSISLAGTLTIPNKEGSFPAVVLISGSGPQNRDQEIYGHKPFLVLSDYLTRNGIAVLRYDDRGTAQSKGDYSRSDIYDFASDSEAAVEYLNSRPEIIKEKIGLIGHSEGGMLAPYVASKDSINISFIVMMAGVGIPPDSLMVMQNSAVAQSQGANVQQVKMISYLNSSIYDAIKVSNTHDEMLSKLTDIFDREIAAISGIPKETIIYENTLKKFLSVLNPWFISFIKYNPKDALSKTKCPVLAINGSKDFQVSSKENLAAIESALKAAGNDKVTIKEFEGLNHLFQTCTTGEQKEYGEIEQTISPQVLQYITEWILTQ